jgi:hypothetical protein
VSDEELARLATFVLDAMDRDAEVLPLARPADARRVLSLWGLLRWHGPPGAAPAGPADWTRALALPDARPREPVAAVRVARALLR